jgi:oxygen-independent coproporphyrinogen-3 oxidase
MPAGAPAGDMGLVTQSQLLTQPPPDFERAVPRYTSYPTAPHFHAGVGASIYRRWLGELDPALPASLYLHIPYCRELCWYCGCNTRASQSRKPLSEYRDRLMREIALVAGALPARMRVAHIHWGGGTPTILPPEDFLALHGRLQDLFDIEPSAEIAIEIDPRTLERPMVAALAEAGVNRASLGVQDFDPRVQRAINRLQPYEMTERAVADLRAAGIANLNFDLIYGLPYQTVDGILKTVDLTAGLRPQRVALFGYAHVPWMKAHQRLIPAETLPDGAARWAQAMAAAERLQAAGYRWIGLDHFTLPEDSMAVAAAAGRLHRNFQGYTTDASQTLLGFGSSAIGALPQGYVQNSADVRSWSAAIADGAPAVVRGIVLNGDDRLRRHVIERLMCDLAVDLGESAARFGQAQGYFAAERGKLEALESDGLVSLDGDRLALTDRGRPLMRLVAAVFDRYLEPAAARHSRAV